MKSAQSEASANREDYLTARKELIGEWTTAGRTHVDVISALAPPAVPFKYDSKERRDALSATLTAAERRSGRHRRSARR